MRAIPQIELGDAEKVSPISVLGSESLAYRYILSGSISATKHI